ncbi:MAG TPA: glycosyltransferase family 25 protein [Candidatus Binatia bacterium]|nr:glycosyltransferase family 25 protein [Candidatus Binatia bacterium]
MVRGLRSVVINLDGDDARLRHMQKELERAGLAFERFAAVRGADVPAALRPYFTESPSPRILSAGEVGCYASHLAVCRRIADGEMAAPVLVLEDDVCLAKDFANALDALLQALPAKWDLVRLSNDPKHACLVIADLIPGRKLVRYSKVPTSAGAILWNRSGAEKFLRRHSRMLPLDQDLRMAWMWDLDTYGVVPAPALRDRCGPSRIDAMAPAGWRGDERRRRLLRKSRTDSALQRHLHGLKAFGVKHWLTAEMINLAAPLIKHARQTEHGADARLLLPIRR